MTAPGVPAKTPSSVAAAATRAASPEAAVLYRAVVCAASVPDPPTPFPSPAVASKYRVAAPAADVAATAATTAASPAIRRPPGPFAAPTNRPVNAVRPIPPPRA